MMIESFTGMMAGDDSQRAGRVPAVAFYWPAVSFRPRTAPLGMERLRSLSRARACTRVRPAVPDDGSAVGLCVLSGSLLSCVRRSTLDSAARAGVVQRADSTAVVRARTTLDRPPHRGDCRAPARRVVVQHG